MEAHLGRNLAGKPVTSSDGANLGTLFNITLDLRTGDLKKLLVTPNRETATGRRPQYPTDSNNRYLIPVEHVVSAGDSIIVE